MLVGLENAPDAAQRKPVPRGLNGSFDLARMVTVVRDDERAVYHTTKLKSAPCATKTGKSPENIVLEYAECPAKFECGKCVGEIMLARNFEDRFDNLCFRIVQ